MEMTRDLEKEYREYVQASAPDIWDRIEQKLDAEAQAPAESRVIRKKVFRWQRLVLPIAAAACVAVAIPALFMNREAANMTAAEPRGSYDAAAGDAAPKAKQMRSETVAECEEAEYDAAADEAASYKTDSSLSFTANYDTEVQSALNSGAAMETEDFRGAAAAGSSEAAAAESEEAYYEEAEEDEEACDAEGAEPGGSVLLISLKEGVSSKEIYKLAEKYSLEVVTTYEGYGTCELKPTEEPGEKELQELIDKLAEEPGVLSVDKKVIECDPE
ncbi:MAG: hypothetical protein IKI75_13405 [Lachnospiraceae bacterium]|nr:hypothetical protein [Lachnospiraceae bacterium]